MAIPSHIDKSKPILIVDDFSTMRRIIKTCLMQLGFQSFVEAENGAAALEKLRASPFMLIVSDWNMPTMMGIDLLKAVRADAQLSSIPFLMVTAEAQKENIIEAAKAGVSNYITKPFTADVMQSKLEAIFTKQQLVNNTK